MNPSLATSRQTQIANRRLIVSEKYLRGVYMSQIADEMGVNISTISRDLSELRKEWLDRSINHIDQKKAIELAKLDRLEVEYWDAWERSKADAETTTLEKLGALHDTTGKIIGTKVKEIKRKEGQVGNPAFLQGVQKCIEKRCELLGLDAPKKTELAGKDGGPVNINVIYDPPKVNPDA